MDKLNFKRRLVKKALGSILTVSLVFPGASSLTNTFTQAQFSGISEEEFLNATSSKQNFWLKRIWDIQEYRFATGQEVPSNIASVLTIKQVMGDAGKWLKRLVPLYFFGSMFADIVTSADILANYVYPIYNWFDNLIFKFTHKGIDIKKYEVLLERIKIRLKAELVGQDEAIDEIINVMRGYFEAVLQAEHLGRKYENGLVLYLIGAPATGKTTVMKIISEEMGLATYNAGMPDVVKDKGNKAVTAADRLYKPTVYNNGKRIVEVHSKLQRCLDTGKSFMFGLDEFGKMRNFDMMARNTQSNSQISGAGGSLDEVARNFMDSGELFGKKTPNSILVLTSNETEDDLKKLENSLYNRYRNCIVKFKDLTADAYKEIMKRQFVNIQKFYKEKFNVNVTWDEKATDLLAKQLEKENLGARAVEVLVNKARSAIAVYRDAYSKNNEFKDITIVLSCEGDSQKLIVNKL